MNALQEATLNMQRSVEQHLDENNTIIKSVPAFERAFNNLKSLNAQIVSTVGGQETPRTGIATDKSSSKADLCNATLSIAKPIRAFAAATGDHALRDEVDYTFSKLNRLRDDQIAPRCQIIRDRAAANLAALADYGITAEKLTDLQNRIDTYSAETPKTRAARAVRSVKTAGLGEFFRESKNVLNQMDDLIDNFAAANAEVVDKYKRLREIDKPPSRPRKPGEGEIKNNESKSG